MSSVFRRSCYKSSTYIDSVNIKIKLCDMNLLKFQFIDSYIMLVLAFSIHKGMLSENYLIRHPYKEGRGNTISILKIFV
jgi:hypothetical protein